MNEKDVNILSASGSRNIPNFETDLNFRACQPSYQSVSIAKMKITIDNLFIIMLSDINIKKNTGDNIILSTDNWLGKVIQGNII